jgi:hypothetical protein
MPAFPPEKLRRKAFAVQAVLPFDAALSCAGTNF